MLVFVTYQLCAETSEHIQKVLQAMREKHLYENFLFPHNLRPQYFNTGSDLVSLGTTKGARPVSGATVAPRAE